METNKRHVLFIALPAFGHITPLLELAKKLTEENFQITFAVSEVRVEEMLQRGYLPQRYRSSIELYALKDGLPADIDSRPGPGHLEEMQLAMEKPLGELLENMASNDPSTGKVNLLRAPVDVVVCDSTMYQPPTVSAKLGVPCYYCHTATPHYLPMIAMDFSTLVIGPDDIFYEPPDPAKPLVMPQGIMSLMTKMQMVKDLTKGMIVNGFEEMDPNLFSILKQIPELADKVIFVGPLLQQEEKNAVVSQIDQERAALALKVTDWLDQQREGSVIYVSFGSMVFPSPKELKTLGEALLSLGQPFIFALRTSQQCNLPEEIREKISGQFESSNAAFLVVPWAEQQKILAHPSTKIFLSHCGYNSTLESISFGKPVVAWPLFADQPINADYLVGLGMAVKITQTALRTKKITTKEEITTALITVGGWNDKSPKTEGDFFSKIAQEMAAKAKTALAPGGSSYKNWQELIAQFRT